MKRILLIIMFASIFSFFASGLRAQSDSLAVAGRMLASSSCLIVDVRTPEEYAGGHNEGSVNIPLSELKSETARLKPYRNLILVCRSGKRAGMAKRELEKEGFRHVCNAGGWETLEKLLKGRAASK
ncbi:MAG: rhodanese-like domain-containing protein [Tannerella sp.]|jgi:phage shock protein E|nr:rhodanese-like domain-containing protein [Tannerella sp.]